MGSEPELRGPILRREIYQGNVDHQSERVGWVGEICVGVHWLTLGMAELPEQKVHFGRGPRWVVVS